MAHPVVYDCPGEGWAEDAGYGPHGVGDPHQDGGVLRSHVQVIHTKSAPVKHNVKGISIENYRFILQ